MVLVALNVLFWIIVVLLMLLTLLVCTPLRVDLAFRSDPAVRSCIDVSPFGGAVGRIRVFDTTRKKAAKKKTRDNEKARKKKERSRKKGGALFKGAIHDLPHVVGQMIRTIHVETLNVHGEFGLNDPAETGQLYGQLTPLIYGFGGKVSIQPNFHSSCLRGAAKARLRVIPIVFLLPIAGALWRMIRGRA